MDFEEVKLGQSRLDRQVCYTWNKTLLCRSCFETVPEKRPGDCAGRRYLSHYYAGVCRLRHLRTCLSLPGYYDHTELVSGGNLH